MTTSYVKKCAPLRNSKERQNVGGGGDLEAAKVEESKVAVQRSKCRLYPPAY